MSICISYQKTHHQYDDADTVIHLGVSKHIGTPKWMVYDGKPY